MHTDGHDDDRPGDGRPGDGRVGDDRPGDDPPGDGLSARTHQALAAALAAVVVLITARADPMLSADSITYLAVGDHLRRLDGFTDFTGEPLTIFGPVYPLLLAVGGRSLVWASVVGAAAAAAASWFFTGLLRLRVRWQWAVVGSLVFVLSQSLLRVEATVWSETPYFAVALAMLYVIAVAPVTMPRAAAAGALAGLSFLTRYAGAGLVITGVVMVVVATWPTGRRQTLRASGAFIGVAAGLVSTWALRNIILTGRPLGPRFEGGATDSVMLLVRRSAWAIGKVVVDVDSSSTTTNIVGYTVMCALLVGAVAILARPSANIAGAGMAVFAITSICVPMAARAVTGNDIESRVMSPTLIPIVYFSVVAMCSAVGANGAVGASSMVGAGRLAARRSVLSFGFLAASAVWCLQGVVMIVEFPDRLAGSAASIEQFSPQLYGLVDELPDDANVLTNNPQRVWWHTGHEPTLFAFTRPRAGNSHYPLSPAQTVREICAGETYLAWFPGLVNAGGATPGELRPDLLEAASLSSIARVPGGELFALSVRDPAACSAP